MVFLNKEWNNTGDIVVYSNYHKYWLDKLRKIKNPLFDVFSGKILDLKEGKPAAVNYFYNLIDAEISKDVTVCVVPSSDSTKKQSGIGMLGEKLAENGRVNKVYYLQRTTSIDGLPTSGNSNKSVYMKTIHTLQDISIKGDVVLLMDDATTTGNSLYACRDILLHNGADQVEMFVLGKAI